MVTMTETPPYQVGETFTRPGDDVIYKVTDTVWNQDTQGWDVHIIAAGIVTPGSDKPDLFWVIKRVYEAGYIKNDKVYIDPIREIIAHAGLAVSVLQLCSALKNAGCPVHKDDEYYIYKTDLEEAIERMDQS